MAIGVFKLSKGQRHILSIVFATLTLIQVLTGVVMLSLSVYIYISVAPVLYSERAEVSYVFGVVGICGFNNMCCYLFGLKIRWKCLNQAYKKSTRSLVFAWTCVTFYVVFYLIILAMLTRKVYKHVVRAMGHSFYLGMSKYLKDELWKVSIDRIQYDLQCCGSHGYKEWYEVPWLSKFHVNLNSGTVKQFHENGSWLFPVVPWSCCRVSFPMQCLHDPLQQVRAHAVWADQHSLTLDSLNTDGCLNKMKLPIKSTITVFILLIILNCVVQFFIFISVRILYTSCRNAIILNDPDGISPGWLFGRGDFGYSRGKTLDQIMNPDVVRKPSPQKNDETTNQLLSSDQADNN